MLSTKESLLISFQLTRQIGEYGKDTVFQYNSIFVGFNIEGIDYSCSFSNVYIECDSEIQHNELSNRLFQTGDIEYVNEIQLNGRVFEDVIRHNFCFTPLPNFVNYEENNYIVAKNFGLIQFTDHNNVIWEFERFE